MLLLLRTHHVFSICLSVCLSICWVLLLRSHIWCDHNFRYTCMISPDFFFSFFLILIFGVIRGVKRKKNSPKWKIKVTSVTHHISGIADIWSWPLIRLCKMMISPSIFSDFFKILIFPVVSEVKGQKMTQNFKRFCRMHYITQEPYIIWLSCMVYICKMIITLGVIFIFQNFDFLHC